METDDNKKLLTKLQQFCKINEQFKIAYQAVNEENYEKKINTLLTYIAQNLLHIPQYFDEILTHFPEELPKILSILIFTETFNNYTHRLNCVALGKIINKRADLKTYALQYFQTNPSPFYMNFESKSKKKTRQVETVTLKDIDIVECCYTLLKSNSDFYRFKWEWSKFVPYLDHPDDQVKWVACHCVAIITGMNELNLNKLLLLKVPNLDKLQEITCKYDLNGTLSEEASDKILVDQHPLIKHAKSKSNVINISGIYIPTITNNIDPVISTTDLVEVESTINNLRNVALGLASNKAVCLQGRVGSGKTSLIEYLAAKTGRTLGKNFIKVQLGDQTDSKMLLGTYRCTDIPGEFVWQPGVLTQAVLEGNWLLLEDIDSASMDIASVLTSLLESGSLTVPGYRDSVPIKPTFQLFVTQRLISTITGNHKKHSNAMKLLEKHLLQVNIEPLSPQELKHVLKIHYKNFNTISERMVNVFLLFNKKEISSIQKSGRLISTRDFFKWCSRAAIDFDVSSQASALKVLQDAIDVFCSSYSNEQEALTLAKDVSTQLGIVHQKAEYFFNVYKPTMNLTPESLIVGRANIRRELNEYRKVVNFTFTRPSAVLLERIMCCVSLQEPVLLVGETGTGKTSSVQYLANTLGQKLVVINMNQQSDSTDLLGGFKPVDLKFVVTPIKREFEGLFCDYFKVEPNRKFLGHIAFCYNEQRWTDLIKLMTKSYEAAIKRLTKDLEEKTPLDQHVELLEVWQTFGVKLHKLSVQIKQKTALAFAFIEGSLVKAIENGYWVLLDEINLASAETLECLSGLLEGSKGSICLLERGDKQPVNRHPNFTLFACMNPSTDVGKKDLPSGLRNRFTEFYVDELTNRNDLLLLVGHYLEAMHLKEKDLNRIVDFYLKVRKETITILSDGLGHKPHYSLRSLCRALSIAASNPCGMFKRSLYEAFSLSFLTQLDSPSYKIVQSTIGQFLLGSEKEVKAILNQPIPEPNDQSRYFQFEGYWVKAGALELEIPENYILTESVRRNLKDLVRVVSIGRLPVLLQGDTSVGKTSLISYLAKSSGNKCVRINNHEHTDLQEYIGSYVADLNGKLVFREGLLVEAMRKGHWIILDELNLAPTDVLEALNRVLDDNRELFIPETQETVRADPNFMLFATQNPPGVYGGRKMLSRAFRNRFVELHFNEIPPKELEFILHQRCEMAPSYAKKMINVMSDLQMRRRGSAAFAGKQGFITLRDLFRWGERYRLAQNSYKLYDWDQHIADEGYLVLAGRVRKLEEKNEIAQVLQTHLKRKVVPDNLFTLSEVTSTVTKSILENIYKNASKFENIVWTYNMRQLAVLVSKALQFKEPVLLVGETGGGKTTVCKLIAENNGQKLITVNCHMHTESSDFIGGLRPIRDHTGDDSATKLFEWVDGPLIQAMVKGNVFLADEISLADDSVLERLNSLLEPERSLLLSEKGTDMNNPENSELILANPNFYFIGTMNPGGDFGKKELSPALRNRFTEIWCESCTKREDLVAIVERNVRSGLSLGNQEDGSSGIGNSIVNFVEWFQSTEIGKRFTVSIRDVLTWVTFLNKCGEKINAAETYVHGASLTFLDSLGSGITSTESLKQLERFRSECYLYLSKQVEHLKHTTLELSGSSISVSENENSFGISPFYIETSARTQEKSTFSFNAPTTLFNTLRLLRGMQLHKAILLEGSPGVGKTSLVSALAKVTGHKLFRVNLSDQTDISDLFGADLPVEGGVGGQFSWRDGPLLQALKQGNWILLDELNLASQSVLEGLNACLDHRGEIFIPELGKTFEVKQGTRFFACQNPLKQGGSRRGLPRSFLNRFIQVYVNSLTDKDLEFILMKQFTVLPSEIISKMIKFNSRIVRDLESFNFGHKGAPWECNLRDLTRWCETVIYNYDVNPDENKRYEPSGSVNLIYADRMRTLNDKSKVEELFEDVFKCEVTGRGPIAYVSRNRLFVGDISIGRNCSVVDSCVLKQEKTCLVLRDQLAVLRSLLYCVNLNWMAILVGNSGAGKTSVVKTLASLCGKTLKILPVTSAMDTTDILGGFEQTDYTRHLDEVIKETERLVSENVQNSLLESKSSEARDLLLHWESFLNMTEVDDSKHTMEEETKLFLRKLAKLENIWNKLCTLTNFRNHTAVNAIRKKGERMCTTVKSEGSLNAGGKFEWVDSILIKCLQEGSWLLIDNVNLCSAAVLDRLNALLEPQGVLTIGERGVDQNGQMVEIKPHEDFRLFLTMDPKNGEISRAMRNRGIELYLLDDKELTSNKYDIKSLIGLQGLSNEKHKQALLDIHNFISDLTLIDKPNINDLLQASRLIWQQINHGTELFEAFYTSVIEIYYKTKSENVFSCNNDTKSAIKYEMEKILSALETSKAFDDDLQNVTIKTVDLQYSSDLAKIKQQCTLIQLDVNKLDTNKESLKYYLMNYYTITSSDDLNIRHKYLQKLLIHLKQEGYCTIIDKLFWAASKKIKHSELPEDCRWLPDAPYKERNVYLNNKTLLTLYLVTQFHEESLYLEAHSKNNIKNTKEMSLLQYMNHRKKDKIEDIFNDILIDEFVDLIKEFDDVLITTLLSNDDKNFNFTNEHTILAMYLLSWRFYFHKYARINIKKISPSECHIHKMNLRVHYHWFIKYSCMKVFTLLELEIPEKLANILNNLNKNIEKQFSELHKLSRLYKKHCFAPPPYINEHQINALSEFNEIINQYDIYERKNNAINTLNILQTNPDLHDLLIKIKQELNYDFEDKSKEIASLKVLHDRIIKNSKLETLDLFSKSLIPITDHFTQLLLKDCLLNNVTTAQVDGFRNSLCVPVELIGGLLRYSEEHDKRVLHEVEKLSYSYLLNSASVKPSKFLSLDENCANELFGHNPKLSFILCKLLINDKNDFAVCSLGNFRKLMEQHKYLNHILWSNTQQLCYENYDYMHFEKEECFKLINHFVNQLSEVFNLNPSEHNSLTEKINGCIKQLEKLDRNTTKLFVNFLKSSEDDFMNLQSANSDINCSLNIISDVYMKISYMKLLLNAKLPLIDPLAKKSLKKRYCMDNIKNFETLNECYKNENEIYSNSDVTLFAFYQPIKEKIKVLEGKNYELGKYVAVRPKNVMYETVTKAVNHGLSTILSEKNVTNALNKLNNFINSFCNNSADLQEVKVYLKQCESSLISYENLIREWSRYCNSYPDIIQPLLSNVVQFLYGYKLKLSLLSKLLLQQEQASLKVNLQECITNLTKFPSIDSNQVSYHQQIIEYTSDNLHDYIDCVFKPENATKTEKFRLLKCAIQDTYNDCIIDAKFSGALNKKLFTGLEKLIKIFVSSWNKQQEELELQQKEAESLYKTKTKCNDPTEDEQIESELKELFPNYHLSDFMDMQKNLDLSEDIHNEIVVEPITQNSEDQFSEIITKHDLLTIVEVHTSLVQNFSKTEWLNPCVNKNIKIDLIQPLIEKYKLFKQIIEKAVISLDYTIDKKIYASLNVLLGVIMRYGDYNNLDEQIISPSKSSKKKQDFYKDSNVEEVKSSYHILEELKLRIKELLDEWPEQPTLTTILTVIERIYSFDITSPLSRFLTGFEILLTKCHEWEEVAHSGVTLSQFSQNITQQVITWRKIELGMWKDLLNITFERLNEPKTKWWLYLYNTMEQFVFTKTITPEELIGTLQTFITKSNLAEFQSRLDLLYTFHCHTTHLDSSKETEIFISILWNLYSYFMQFSVIISNRIKDLRSPIEKKLKDYVKIVRWKDVSYWSIKETIEKSHKYLHKFMREFKEVLIQPVTPYLTNIGSSASEENVGIWDRPQRQNPKTYHYTLDPEAYIVKSSLLKKVQTDEESKLENYFIKCRKLCKEAILATKYPKLVQSLEGLLNQVVETSTYLQKLEVDTTLPKNKQKSQAKSILNQKHRALADLFKNLSKIGLSFRTGIMESKLKIASSDFVLKPIDLNASFSHLNSSRREEKILTIWDSCEVYYIKSLIRSDVLETAMKNPAQDLGMQNLERCKGFTFHLLNLAQNQKSELIETSRIFYYLRFYCNQITNACEGKETVHIDLINKAREVLKSTLIVMNQYKIIFNTCPEEDGLNLSNAPAVPILKPESSNFVKFKYDAAWNDLISLINDIVSISTKLLVNFEKAKSFIPSIEKDLICLEYVPIQDVNAVKLEINTIINKLVQLKVLFNKTALSDSVVFLNRTFVQIHDQLEQNLNEETTNQYNINDFKQIVEKLTQNILLVIQNVYKKYCTNLETDKTQENIDFEETVIFEEHLKQLMIKNLSHDISTLQMKKILKCVHKITETLATIPVSKHEEFKSTILRSLPFLEQIVLLYEYFLTQQVSTYRVTCKMTSILLNIFLELTTKGFCVPPEFSDEMNEEGISKPSDGLGLGEGEGERDVSDKIESEDQLDDAQPAGQEREKEEDKDCKEEEKGIEMSEDFDSKLQDKEKKEDDEDDDNSDNNDSDADEQMGETEKGADKLDQEIWGSDNEEEENADERGDQKEEKGNKGEKESEPELAANEDNINNKQDNNDEEGSKEKEDEKKPKKDINEMEEPEYDDEQVDPYHGNQPELPEPEAMDLPDDLQLDDGEEKNTETPEENPFDIDSKKEQLPEPEEEEANTKGDEQEKKKDEADEFSSDDEDIINKPDDTEGAKEEEDNKENDGVEEKNNVNSEDQLEKEDDDKEAPQEDDSVLDQTQSKELNLEAMEVDNAETADKTEANMLENQKSDQAIDDLNQEDKPDKEGVGQSQMEESQTGHNAQTSAPQEMQSSKRERDEDIQKQQKPGESDSQRSLGNVNEPVKKKLKTVDTQEKDNAGDDNEENNDEVSEMYKHIKEAKENAPQVLDAATKEQTEAQQNEIPNVDEEEAEIPTESSTDLPPEEEENIEMKDESKEIKPEKSDTKKDKKTNKTQHPEGEILDDVKDIAIEGDLIETSTVPRSGESTHHTQYSVITEAAQRLSFQEINTLRSEVELQLSAWNEPPSNLEAEQTWHKISSVTSSLAQDLSEQLRLVLEPTQASRLKGDFRTGRRINMRKIIPYIASQFRKDKIWLRRTKPSKREYQIVLAIDDSSSMADNKSKELAFESVSLISKALTLLESGQLSVMSFGETIEVVHKLTDTFTEKSGVKLLQTFKFDQNKTCVAKLVDFASEMLQQAQAPSSIALNAKLLVIVSDGRGVFSEGEIYVQQAVRRASLANIFMIFIIIDNPDNKNSVLDIRMPVFKDGKLQGIHSYMDVFPFSFYIILKDIKSLPNVLSDALRQWFEIVSNVDK